MAFLEAKRIGNKAKLSPAGAGAWLSLEKLVLFKALITNRVLIYQVSNIEYLVSSIQYPVSSIKYQVSSIKYQVSIIMYQASSFQSLVSSIKYRESGCK